MLLTRWTLAVSLLAALAWATSVTLFAGEESPAAPREAPLQEGAATSLPIGPSDVHASGPDVYLLPDGQGGLRRVLGYRYEDFQRARRLESAQLSGSPPRWTLTSLELTGRADQRVASVRLEMDVRLDWTGWVELDLGLGSLAVSKAEMAGEANVASESPAGSADQGGAEGAEAGEFFSVGRDGRSLSAWVRGKAGDRRRLVVEGELLLRTTGADHLFQLELPLAVRSTFALEAPYEDALAEASDGTTVRVEPLASGRSMLRGLARGGLLSLQWRPRDARQTSGDAPYEGSLRMMVQIDPGRVRYDVSLALQTFGRARERVEVLLPPGTSLVRDEDSTSYTLGVVREAAGGRTTAEVRFPSPQVAPPPVRIVAEQASPLRSDPTSRAEDAADPSEQSEIRIVAPRLIGAVRESGVASILVHNDLLSHYESEGVVERIAVNELPEELQDGNPRAAFAFGAGDWSIDVQASPSQRRAIVRPSYALRVTPQGAEMDVEYDYRIVGGRTFDLELDLRGWDFREWSIESGGSVSRVGTWRKKGILSLPLNDPDTAQVRLRFAVHQEFAEAPLGKMRLPLPRALEAYMLPASIELSSDSSLQVTPRIDESTGVALVDASLPMAYASNPQAVGPEGAVSQATGSVGAAPETTTREATGPQAAASPASTSAAISPHAPRTDAPPGDATATGAPTSAPRDVNAEGPAQRLRAYLPNAVIAVDVAIRQREMHVQRRVEATLSEQGADVVQRFDFRVRHQPASELRLRVPASLASNGSLDFLLNDVRLSRNAVQWIHDDGRPDEAIADIDAGATPADKNELDVERLAAIRLPRPAQGEWKVALTHRVGMDVVPARAGRTLTIPLASAETELASAQAVVSAPPKWRVALAGNDSGGGWSIDAAQDAAQSGLTTLRANRDVRQLALVVTDPTSETSPNAVVDRMWVQSWVVGGLRQDRQAVRFWSASDHVVVTLPEGARELGAELLCDGTTVTLPPAGETKVDAPLADRASPHVLEFRVHRPETLRHWNSFRADPLTIEGAQMTGPVFWQVIVPAHFAALSEPQGMTPEYEVAWRNFTWGRQPVQEQSDFEAWVGASTLASPSLLSSRYVFSGFVWPQGCRIALVRRVWLLAPGALALFAAGAAWASGGVLVRRTALSLALGGAIALVAWHPEAIAAFLQASTLASVLVGGAALVHQRMTRTPEIAADGMSGQAPAASLLAQTRVWPLEGERNTGHSSPSAAALPTSGSAP